jgi:hypothetical protein
MPLNFGGRKRSGAFDMIWPSAKLMISKTTMANLHPVSCPQPAQTPQISSLKIPKDSGSKDSGSDCRSLAVAVTVAILAQGTSQAVAAKQAFCTLPLSSHSQKLTHKHRKTQKDTQKTTEAHRQTHRQTDTERHTHRQQTGTTSNNQQQIATKQQSQWQTPTSINKLQQTAAISNRAHNHKTAHRAHGGTHSHW